MTPSQKVPTRETCPDCNDTGYVGDNGPGWRGNGEVMPCDCDPQARAIRNLQRRAAVNAAIERKEK